MRINWYWIQEFGGNGISTLAIGIFTFLFAGIAIMGEATFGHWFASPVMVPLLVLWGLVTATRLADDLARVGFSDEQHGGWYWAMEFIGDTVMVIGLAWMLMVVATVNVQGYHTFVENNPWILWSEIPTLVLMGVAVSLNWVNDIIRFKKEHRG